MKRKQRKHRQIKTSFVLRSHMMKLPTKTELVIFFTETCGHNGITDNQALQF